MAGSGFFPLKTHQTGQKQAVEPGNECWYSKKDENKCYLLRVRLDSQRRKEKVKTVNGDGRWCLAQYPGSARGFEVF
jgi:hypothetical protein